MDFDLDQNPDPDPDPDRNPDNPQTPLRLKKPKIFVEAVESNEPDRNPIELIHITVDSISAAITDAIGGADRLPIVSLHRMSQRMRRRSLQLAG